MARGAEISFLVIGGQKCATTTLFRHLSTHPQVYMPPQKEVNFFAKPRLHARGADWYREQFFAGAPAGAILGEASPLYLASASAPERIRQLLPDVKLVAMLRNPIDRAYSHYRMAVRRGLEDAPFGECIREQATRGEPPPEPEDTQRDYLAFGHYGSQVGRYLRCFARPQLHVEFAEDLKESPGPVMQRITQFVGADPGFRYPDLGRVYHAGGESRLPPTLVRAAKRGLSALRPLVGASRAKSLAFWLETEGSVRRERDTGPSRGERAFLADLYAKDVAQLTRALGVRPPWPDFG